MDKHPKVLFLDQSGQIGGAELCLMDIAGAFLPGSEVLLFQDGPFAELLREREIAVAIQPLRESAAVISKQSGLLSALGGLPALGSLIRTVAKKARSYEVIYANTAKAMVVGAMAAFLSRKPLVYHLHDVVDAAHFSSTNRRLLITLSNWRAAAVVCNSQATQDAFVNAGGKRERTTVIFNGFDAETLCRPAAKSPIKAECGMGEHPVAMIAGRLTPWKGQHVFIQAVAQVDGLHGWIAGEALFTDGDRAYAIELRQLVSDLKLQDRIHFLGFRDDLIPLYQSADIIAHCSTAPEPFGRVIVEGMLCGKPVVATRLGGACEIIEDRDTGLLVEPGNPEALADAMRMLIDDMPEAHRLAQSGQASALQRFDIKQVRQQIEEVIQGVTIA